LNNIETYDATVLDNQDPDQRGGIQVSCVGLFGSDEVKYNTWIYPKLDWGWFYIPDIGEEVEIEVVTGSDKDQSYGQAFIEAPNPCWLGKRYYNSDTPINEEFLTNYGKRRGFATPAGHTFIFDDTEGSELITINCVGGHQFIMDNSAGTITISYNNGAVKIVISDNSIQLGENATEPIVLGQLFKAIFDAHTHPTMMGPSGPPAIPLPPTVYSQLVTSL